MPRFTRRWVAGAWPPSTTSAPHPGERRRTSAAVDRPPLRQSRSWADVPQPAAVDLHMTTTPLREGKLNAMKKGLPILAAGLLAAALMSACDAESDPAAAPTAGITPTSANIPATMPTVTTTQPPDRPILAPTTPPVSATAPTDQTPETESETTADATAPTTAPLKQNTAVASPGTDRIPEATVAATASTDRTPKTTTVVASPGTDSTPEIIAALKWPQPRLVADLSTENTPKITVASTAPDDDRTDHTSEAIVAVATTIPNLSIPTDEIPLRVAQISQSVPLIETAESKRSGILIEGGYIVTGVDYYADSDGMSENTFYHYGASIDPTYEFNRVVFPNGEEFKNVPLVGLIYLSGLAVLGPVDASAPSLNLKKVSNIVPRSELFSIGYSPHNTTPQPIFFTRRILMEDGISEWWGMDMIRTDSTTYEHQIGGPIVNRRGEIIGIDTDQTWGGALSASSSSAGPIVDGLIKGCVFFLNKLFTETESEEFLPRVGEYISVLFSTKSWPDLIRSWIKLDCQDEHGLDKLHSDYYEGLNPGYYVLYSGTYSTPEEAQNTCWELNRRTPDLCYVRRLSHDPQDRATVYPPNRADVQPTR